MMIFFVGLTAVLLVAMLSRDHDISASQETIVTAELNLGPTAVAQFPDQVHLLLTPLNEFAFLDRVRMAHEGLTSEGFRDAGAYRIDEMPGVGVVLMVNARARMTATVYAHERAGVWVEIVTRYEDGSRWTHTTLEGNGLSTRPGNMLVSLPGVSLAELLGRARADRPAPNQSTLSRDEVKVEFEADYADWVAARKRQVGAGEYESADADEAIRLAA